MVEAAPPPPASPRPRSGGCFRWFAVVVLSLGLIGGVLVWQLFGSAKEAISWLKELPAHIFAQEISESFRASITEIKGTNGDILEVATLQTDETITKYDTRSAFNNLVYLGTTVSEIRTPVVYRYHINLSEEWEVSVVNHQCIVRAPVIKPSLPPAIRTEGLEKKSDAGWLRFNADQNLADLEKELTPTLEKRAGNKSHIDLVRESARKSVAEFVKKWLIKDDQNTTGEVRSIIVIFPDEPRPPDGQPMTQQPTLKFP